MVLGWRRPGRVGRCRIPNEKDIQLGVFFIFHPMALLFRSALAEFVSTWLGLPSATSCGCNEAGDKRPKEGTCEVVFASATAGLFSYLIGQFLAARV